jgi:PHD/YefM family antitoxin component YafN of YafNO toxin-antitoxin module
MSDLVRVPAGEFQKNVGHYSEVSLKQPVIVTHNGRDRNVYISNEEYQRLKRRDREVLGLDDFSEADLAAIRATKPSRAAAKFDRELK